MPDFDIAAAKKRLIQQETVKRRAHETLRQQAEEDCRRIVDYLVKKYNPKRIYKWGSMLSPGKFTTMSDIDIAVEGLAGPLDGLHAQGDAEELTDFPVDLVELERIHPLHAKTIRERGKILYERR